MATACPNCGTTKNPPSAAFCSVCSKPLPKPKISSGLVVGASLTNGGRKYALSSGAPTLIGSRGCAILLSGVGVQPQHAKLTPSGSGFLIEPLMGVVQVNGKSVSGATPIPSGAVIMLGSQSLTYAGPGAYGPPLALPLPKAFLSKWTPKISLPKINLTPLKNFIKSVTSPAPKLEGHILMVDGPHMEQPDLEWAGLIFRIMMGLMLLPLVIVFMIFMPNIAIPLLLYGIRPGATPQVPARYLRVQDATGKQHIVKMKGDIMWGMLSHGDDAQFWGRWQGGNLVMDSALNKATNSQVMLKTVFQRRIYLGVLASIFLCTIGNALISVLAIMFGGY